ncbi:MAG: ATP phosphoribosyltransferase regulatory subunit [Clostridia bacterium]|nr:ATP phosphoribosyltransferase regulatory subunit [Clostridia bacterium]
MYIPDSVLHNDERAVFALRALYGSYGYTQYKMNKFEEYDLYAGNKSFLVSEDVITFTDRGGKLMALKPDVTLSIVRSAPKTARGVRRVFYDENVYRVPKGGSSFKEIKQLGIECIGETDSYCVSEVISLAAKSLALISPEWRLEVSNLDLLSEAAELAGLSPRGKALAAERISKKDTGGLREVCFAEGLRPQDCEPLFLLASVCGAPAEVIKTLRGAFKSKNAKCALDETERVLSGVPEKGVSLDFSVVGDTNYYNGMVFKGYVNGIPLALISGGRYDNLMARMGRDSRAAGFAVYIDLLGELPEPAKEYDFDVLLVAGEVAQTARAAEKLVSGGESVFVAGSADCEIRARRTVKAEEVKS